LLRVDRIQVSRGCLGAEELAEVKTAFEYGYFGLAARVTEFEEQIKKYLGSKHVVATSTGTSALHLALDAVGIGEGDEVIVPSLTFVACFQAIVATGAVPVACDVYPETLLMDTRDVQKRMTSRTKAIMPIHFCGNPCDMDTLLDMSQRSGIRLIEDAAHAFGSTYKGKKIGSFGDISCFSFDSIKTITCGEGGAVACADPEVAEIIRQKRLLGIDKKSHASTSWKDRTWLFEVKTQGFRYHMSNINAAIGLAQLRKVESFIERRRFICKKYDEAFKSLSELKVISMDYDQVAPHIYVVRIQSGRREGLMNFLKERDIETTINYIPNHLHPFFRKNGLHLPETERVYKEILTLPLHYGLSDLDVDRVIECVRDFFGNDQTGG